MLKGHHHVPKPRRAGVALVGLRRAARCNVLDGAEPHDLAFAAVLQGKFGSDRNMMGIRAGDDDAGLIKNCDHGPVALCSQIGEYQFCLVFESEAEAEDAKDCAVGVRDAKCVEQ